MSLKMQQSSKIPAFRQIFGISRFTIKKNLILEPIGKSAPKFTTDSRSHTFYREKGTPTALLCAAQGAPIPSTRLNNLL